MGGTNLIWAYVQACLAGTARANECGPIWQLAAILVILLAAIVLLIVLVRNRLHSDAA